MKNTYTILSILIYIHALVIPVFPVFNYVVNTDIYEALCINKDKPELKCHGKCHLSEELNKSESEQESTPLLDINLNDYPIANVNFIELDELIPTNYELQTIPSKDYSFHIELDIFHPPKQSV